MFYYLICIPYYCVLCVQRHGKNSYIILQQYIPKHSDLMIQPYTLCLIFMTLVSVFSPKCIFALLKMSKNVYWVVARLPQRLKSTLSRENETKIVIITHSDTLLSIHFKNIYFFTRTSLYCRLLVTGTFSFMLHVVNTYIHTSQ